MDASSEIPEMFLYEVRAAQTVDIQNELARRPTHLAFLLMMT